MVRNQVNRIVGGAFLVLALVGAQHVRADDKKMALTRPLKAGTVTTYKATIKANVQGMDIILEQSQKQTIKSIKDNGNFVVYSEDLGGKITLNGTDQEQKPGAPSTETRDKLGKLIDLAHEQEPNAPFTQEIQKLMAATGELLLTDKEVGEGDSWDTTFDNPASKDNKVKIKTTYQGIDKVGGVDLWKFKQTSEAVVNADGSKMVNESTIWMNPKDGLMEKIDAKLKDVPTQFGPLELAMVIQRVKPAAAADTKTDK